MDELFDSNPKDEMVEMLNHKITDIKRRQSEIKDQIDSMQNSVEREKNRYANIAIQLRSIKENLDTTPRVDIRDKYDEGLDVRFRLATMRGQLEKFEANYEYMSNQTDTLQQVLTAVQGFDSFGEDENSNPLTSGEFDIVGLIRTQEEERQRLARAMHDGPAQSLTNFILQAEICQRLFERNPDRASEELDNLKTNASRTFQKVRDFIFDLRPMMLDDLGVAPTIRRYVESYREKNDIEVPLDILGEERRLENYREVMIFRGLQDVMGMARDYANPNELKITLDMAQTAVILEIIDNGRGFNSEGIFEDSNANHTDARVDQLRMLRSRWGMVGGTVEVTSDETDGTRIRMELPSGE